MSLSESFSLPYRQVVERYCHVIDGNAVFVRTHTKDGSFCECLNLSSCKESGGCRNLKYSACKVSK